MAKFARISWRSGLAAAAVCTLGVGAAMAAGPFDDWVGVYKFNFKNGTVQGESYRAENILEVVEVDSTHAYVRTELSFFNGHTCSFRRVAKLEGDRLVYRGPKDDKQAPCVLTVSHKTDKKGRAVVELDDEAGRCRDTGCGARGAFEGINWAVTARKPIKYLERLRKSPEYADALKESGLAPTK